MDKQPDDNQFDDLPDSIIQPRSRFSLIWLVPLVAVLIGAWIAYKAWSNMGPTITITFKTADGLEAGKTKIKYQNVEIGKVNAIALKDNMDGVVVTAELVKDGKKFLSKNTRFWVVTARVAASGVSGLETLLSGAYIGIDPSTGGVKTKHFIGLEKPPVITRGAPGKHFILHANNLGSIERGVPIYYRKFNVGRVVDYHLNDDGKSVTIEIFVLAPFDQWINNSTRFWNSSGLNFKLDANGIKVDTDSLLSIVVGGIAFETPNSDENIEAAKEHTVFKFFNNKAEAFEKDYKSGHKYVLNFKESVRGLTVGAPVEFRGIQLGEVTGISLSYISKTREITIPVSIVAELGRMAFHGSEHTKEQLLAKYKQRLDHFIAQGLRAQLKTGNLLTGQLYVDVDFFEDAEPYTIDWSANIIEFPTVPTTLVEIGKNIKDLLDNANNTLIEIKKLSANLNHRMVPEISATLKQTEKSLLSMQTTLQNDSPMQQDLQMMLKELTKAARSVKTLTDYLERHPEALISGKKEINNE